MLGSDEGGKEGVDEKGGNKGGGDKGRGECGDNVGDASDGRVSGLVDMVGGYYIWDAEKEPISPLLF